MPAYYRCYNPDCSPNDLADGFDFSGVEAKCPKCHQGRPVVVDKTAIHLLVKDKEKGKVIGAMGSKWRCLCDKEKAHFVAPTEAATDDRRAVTCPRCLEMVAILDEHQHADDQKKHEEELRKFKDELDSMRTGRTGGI